jgi:hypothetical protein
MPVTTQDMRSFALECLRWSDETDNASQRDLIVQVAKSWMNIASGIERRVDGGCEIVADLRTKLD